VISDTIIPGTVSDELGPATTTPVRPAGGLNMSASFTIVDLRSMISPKSLSDNDTKASEAVPCRVEVAASVNPV